MSFKSRFYATAALVSLFALVALAPFASAQAGQLFPPSNIGTNPNVTCPNGQVLGWTGDAVACTNPTPGVTTGTCPAGSLMVQVSGGTAVCANPTPGVTVSCLEGEVLTGITNGVPVCAASGSTTTTSTTTTVSAAGNVGYQFLPPPSNVTIANLMAIDQAGNIYEHYDTNGVSEWGKPSGGPGTATLP